MHSCKTDTCHAPVQLLQRDRLVACLHEHVEENCEHVSIEHGVTVHDVSVRDDGHVEARWRRADGSEGASEAQFLVRSASRCGVKPPPDHQAGQPAMNCRRW